MFKRLDRLREIAFGAAQDLAHVATHPGARSAYWAELRHLPEFAGLLPWLWRSQRGMTLMHCVARNAERRPGAVALRMDDQVWTWGELEARVSAGAHRLRDKGVTPGACVALIGRNSLEYVAAAYAIGRAGGVAALVNHQLRGDALRHAVSSADARWIVCDEEFAATAHSLTNDLTRTHALVETGTLPPFPLERRDQGDDFLYIYTSGTTGLPKPCRLSHGRALLAGAGAATLGYRLTESDVLYCVLPLYHANAFLLGMGAVACAGSSVALRDGFSARAFWTDVARYRATAFNYIGELGRYLAASKHGPEGPHTLRVAFGNGLRTDAWKVLKERFAIPEIREFYAATESPGGFLNLSERPGSIGHLPLRRVGWMKLARYDAATGELVRGKDGFLQECERDEPGELLVRLADKALFSALEFRGYTDEVATRRKVLQDCFAKGDRFFRSGDLLRYDEDDFFYFVDRVGDTYRWRGENVSTQEVVERLGEARGLAASQIAVVGVEVPGQEGRAGLVAVTTHQIEDALEALAEVEMPTYARPRFVRHVDSLAATGTFKRQTTSLRSEGADPSEVEDDLYYWDGAGYQPLDEFVWRQISEGKVRL